MPPSVFPNVATTITIHIEKLSNFNVAIKLASDAPGNNVALKKPELNNTHNAESALNQANMIAFIPLTKIYAISIK